MLRIEMDEACSKLSALLAAVEGRGECVRICRNGKAIAELRPITRPADPIQPNARLMPVEFRDDPVRPLDADEWRLESL